MKYAAAALLGWTGIALAAAPTPTDFAYGISLAPEPGFAIHDLTLPDSVYRGVTRDDLGDLRVFNSDGVVVPHGFCGNPATQQSEAATTKLAVFPLPPGTSSMQVSGTQLSVRTAEGTEIELREAGGGAPDGSSATTEFLIDARGAHEPIRELKLEWQLPDGGAETEVRVDASDDLDQWRTVVASSALLRVTANGTTVERSQVALPEARYSFLRVKTLDEKSGFLLSGVQAETIRRSSTAPPQVFFYVDPQAFDPDKPHIRTYRTESRAPVTHARLELPQANMLLQVEIGSRAAPEQGWRNRGAGTQQSLKPHDQAGLPLSPGQDPLWRVEVIRGAESLGSQPLKMQLGYTPPRLRFLGQGTPPFLLAYGSRRVSPAALMHCDTLRGDRGEVAAAPAHAINSRNAMIVPEPPPEPLPVRRIVLWCVLGGGVLLVVLMAMNLLGKLKKP